MSGGRVQRDVEVLSPHGLHIRPLTAFAQRAAAFQSSLRFGKEGRWVDGKSPWEMTMMISLPGTIVSLDAEGPDAEELVTAVLAEMQRWVEIDKAADAAE
jgi:phosphocarrier protein HPr